MRRLAIFLSVLCWCGLAHAKELEKQAVQAEVAIKQKDLNEARQELQKQQRELESARRAY